MIYKFTPLYYVKVSDVDTGFIQEILSDVTYNSVVNQSGQLKLLRAFFPASERSIGLLNYWFLFFQFFKTQELTV